MPARFELSTPDNQRKLDTAAALAQLAGDGTAGPPDTSFPHIATTHEPPE
ncbi:MAG: hypothetical protein QOE30_3924, partial [Mycobacterium sp.]|jgi:hypothetical protein|nr:hypothetical protein [Mycobacterium sp.]